MAGVVLAAGAGTRYGTPKILAEQGRWLIAAVRALADGGCDSVWVTTGAARPRLPEPAREIYVPHWKRGMSESVRTAIEVVSATPGECGVLVLHTVDTPDVTAAVTARVLGQHSSAPGLTRAAYHGAPGHPVVIGRCHWPGLLDTLAGDSGARAFLARHDTRMVECGDLASGADIDVRT